MTEPIDWFRLLADIRSKTGLSYELMSERLGLASRTILEDARAGRVEPRYSIGKAIIDWHASL